MKKKNILILYSSPHPDVAPLVNSIKKDEEYNVNSKSLQNFNETDFISLNPCYYY